MTSDSYDNGWGTLTMRNYETAIELEPSDDYTNISDYLSTTDNFVSFSDGLLRWCQKNRDSKLNKSNIVDYLYEGFKSNSIRFNKVILKKWITGETNPQINMHSRKNIFKLCFALKMNYAEVNDFMNKVYLDRSFNLKDELEIAYYFAFNNNYSYLDVKKIIEEVKKMNIETNATDSLKETRIIMSDLNKIDNESDLLKYIQLNQKDFNKYNITAKKRIQENLIKAYDNIKTEISKTYTNLEDNVLYSKWYKDSIGNANVDATLDLILNYNIRGKRVIKNSKFLQAIKLNFPQGYVISACRNEKKQIGGDALRKVLIILFFYNFCISNIDDTDFGDDFICECNDLLYSCGLSKLYPRNPYDWIFIHCAFSNEEFSYSPLDEFRNIMISMLDM